MMLATCAHLCAESYNDKSPDFITIGDLRYGVFDTLFGKIICIRGTANLDNWLTDARAFPARSCGGYLAHKGFVSAYRELCAGGMPTTKGQKVIATGHSLGGALATLLAEHTGCRLVTFGSPRVYWRFGSAPKLNHIRIVRDDDPVPMIPALFYSHRSRPLALRDSDHHLIQVKDHSMAGYSKALATYKGVVCAG
jgi:pimeloyl-ACP methyl ester carboxylesterase